jgi:YidC/Oxa1 family membrane protein insertase
MNNQRTPFQHFVVIFALAIAASYFFQNFFGDKTKSADTAPKAAPKNALATAFAGLDPQKPVLDKATASAEIKKLDEAITKNGSDANSYWSRLRAGLLEQYVIRDTKLAVKRYSEVVDHGATDEIAAQAAYQKGDLLWRESTFGGGQPTSEAAKALEALVHKGRGSSAFLDHEIYVPAEEVDAVGKPVAATAEASTEAPASEPATATNAAAAIAASATNAATNTATTSSAKEPVVSPAAIAAVTALPTAWKIVKVRDLHGDWNNPNPYGLLERVNEYYSYTPYYKVFDWAAKLFGNNPAYSFGLAILVFAFMTRLLLQPLNKKQYDSMKGMAVIAPEMKKIQDRYKSKKDQESQVKMMAEIRTLQKRHGVNPMVGCGLAMVQIPVFLFVVSPFIQHYEAKMELVGASFLWINNLARPDIPLLVIYALSQFASMRLSATPPADDQQRQMQLMMLFFPFAVPFFLLSWPSAFTLYWMTFNVMSMFFQYRMMKAADPDKRFWNTLVMQPLIPQIAVPAGSAPAAEAVPARPKSGRADGAKVEAVKTLAPTTSLTKKATGALPTEAKRGANTNGHSTSAVYETASDADTFASDGAGAGNSTADNNDGGAVRNGTGKTRRKRRY